MHNPKAFFKILKDKYGFKLKGVGNPEYHLGVNFGCDPDGTLHWSAKSYIDKMLKAYERMFGGPPSKRHSCPMEKDDHPELDDTSLLSEEDIKVYQSMIGALQWAITLGRFDISVAVMSMSRFHIAPRKGHLERLKRIYGYLRKHPSGAIRFRTGIPDNEKYFEVPDHDWMYSVYGDGSNVNEGWEEYPEPLGNPVRISSFKDSSLEHCKVTGKSVTGIIHLINQTPIAWFSKLQGTVETTTYGSEFVAARQCSEQIRGLQETLKSMGIPIERSAWMLGDNSSVITSSTIPSSLLKKRHHSLSYHYVRSCVAHEFIKFCFVNSKQNVADACTKFYPLLIFGH